MSITPADLAKARAEATFRVVQICSEINDERQRQDAQWGGPDHDDKHDDLDWFVYRKKFEDRGRFAKPEETRDALIKIAALAVAQIESLDRKVARERAAAVPPTQDLAG